MTCVGDVCASPIYWILKKQPGRIARKSLHVCFAPAYIPTVLILNRSIRYERFHCLLPPGGEGCLVPPGDEGCLVPRGGGRFIVICSCPDASICFRSFEESADDGFLELKFSERKQQETIGCSAFGNVERREESEPVRWCMTCSANSMHDTFRTLCYLSIM